MQFRLHIDIPLGYDEGIASETSEILMKRLETLINDEYNQTEQFNGIPSFQKVQYRLGHDEDRQNSNYLRKNDQGHVTKKKCVIVFKNDEE